MKIAISVLGSTGDVLPFLALGMEFIRRGHQVRLCASSTFRAKSEACGLEFFPTAPHIAPQDINVMMETTFATIRIDKALDILVTHLLLREAHDRLRDCVDAMRDCDLAICHHVDIVGQEAAIKSKIPWISAVLYPGALPTNLEAPAPPIKLSLGQACNRLLWAGFNWSLKSMTRTRIDAFLSEIGSPRRNVGIVPLAPGLNLLGASRHIGFIFPDFAENIVATGNWFLEEPDNYTAPEELRQFLSAGPPPVVVTFGSMGGRDGGATGAIVAEAIKRADLRAIVQKGWGGVSVTEDARFLSIDYVPHSYLFEHALCIVHHGGAGTAAAACRAGKPSIVVPHAGDQYYWARCLTERGVAPRMLPRGFLTARRLQWRLQQVNAGKFSRTAAELGEKVRSENGVGVAVDAVEAWAKLR